MDIWNDFKRHPGLGLIFLAVGFSAGLGAYRYVSGIFNADVVLHDSYIYKSEIEKSHVPIERYQAIADELNSTKSDNENLKKLISQLQASQSAISVSVCQRFVQEMDTIMFEQQQTEREIQSLLSPNILYIAKNEQQLQADSKRVQELRKHSELLNQQLIQVRSEIAKCAK
jgi:hypothetical protein